MIRIYRNMSCEEWFYILNFIQDIRKSNSEIAKMNQKTYKIFEYLKAKYIGCFAHINKDGKFKIFNEYMSLKDYKTFAPDSLMKSTYAMICGYKILIDETVNDEEIII